MEQLTVQQLGARAQAVAGILASASPKQKNDALAAIADALISRTEEIIAANKVDLENAVKNNMSKAGHTAAQCRPHRRHCRRRAQADSA